MSDRDMLLVGSLSPALDQAVARWTAREWNVSVFDPLAFKRLADVKGLFIQHLKQEGRILHDHDDFLGSVLRGYSPKADYSPQRNDALAQICALPPAIGSYWHDLCLADIAYVLFRNAAILHLACAREYCFQYDVLISLDGESVRLGPAGPCCSPLAPQIQARIPAANRGPECLRAA